MAMQTATLTCRLLPSLSRILSFPNFRSPSSSLLPSVSCSYRNLIHRVTSKFGGIMVVPKQFQATRFKSVDIDTGLAQQISRPFLLSSYSLLSDHAPSVTDSLHGRAA